MKVITAGSPNYCGWVYTLAFVLPLDNLIKVIIQLDLRATIEVLCVMDIVAKIILSDNNILSYFGLPSRLDLVTR